MAKVIEVVVYEANDGSRFDTEAACNAHDFALVNGAKIDTITEAFLNTIGAADRSRSIQGNVVKAFLAFHLARVEAGTELEPVERTVMDTVKEVKAEGETVTEGAEPAAEVASEVSADAAF